VPETYTPRHLAERILDSRAVLEGERKQVTVLFADLKGSMELLADRDPEDARRILDPVLERMMEAVHRYEGTVNQVMGDGIMALFGAPIAHEDHAVRACYAALAMQESIRRYTEDLRRTHGVEVQIRVGLNSGEVVVRSIGSDLRMDYSAVGQTTHAAARMEQLATPGTIRLSGETLRLAEGFVEVRPLGPVPVKGLADPVDVYELTGAIMVRTRLQALGVRGLTRFVGRDLELEQLRQAAQDARRGRGQVVAVVGEPGVGKSRLFYEFVRSHHARDWRILESGAAAYGKGTPYLPVTDLLRVYFQIESRDDARAIRAKVTGNLLTLDDTLQEAIPALLWLLEVLPEDSAFVADPAERRRRTLAAVKRVLLRESQQQPLLLVLEDLHWIDSETQAVLDSLVESLPTAPVLIAVNYRPEYRHGWGSKTYYRQLRIDPLARESADDLLAGLLGQDPSIAPLRAVLISRTEGNPLFLEESVRTLVETGALTGHRGAYRLVKGLEAVRVPATVQTILAARIDRLAAEDKRLLQAAAVVGTDVPFALLREVAGFEEEALRRGLGRLQASEFVYEARLFPELEYTFNHALTHEVAYGSLLSERRQMLHRDVVGAIERLYPDRLGEHVERLAHHALRGDLRGRAVTYLRQAGDKAVARSANREAVAIFEQALTLLRGLEETPQTLLEAADVRLALGPALITLQGAPAAEIEAIYVEARAAAEHLGDATRLYLALWGLWYVNYTRGRYVEARDLGSQLLRVAEGDGDTGRLLEAHHAVWATLVGMGEAAAALPHLERGVSLYDPQRHGSQAFLYGGHDPGACCRYHLGTVRWYLGYPDAALAPLRDARELADELDHPMTTAITLCFAGWVYYLRGDRTTARETAERLIALTTSHGFASWIDDGGVVLACLDVDAGGDGKGLSELFERLVQGRGRAAWRNAICLTRLAGAFAAVGDVPHGLAALAAIPAEHQAANYAPEVERVRGELMVLAGQHDEAADCLRRAIALARRRSERSLELRAATSLARVLNDRGKRDEARTVLELIYFWFTEGFDTADLKAARALLDALA
jgi:class 3 adenylate cyclase/tetratricopeptide (TPR) repeat protein